MPKKKPTSSELAARAAHGVRFAKATLAAFEGEFGQPRGKVCLAMEMDDADTYLAPFTGELEARGAEVLVWGSQVEIRDFGGRQDAFIQGGYKRDISHTDLVLFLQPDGLNVAVTAAVLSEMTEKGFNRLLDISSNMI